MNGGDVMGWRVGAAVVGGNVVIGGRVGAAVVGGKVVIGGRVGAAVVGGNVIIGGGVGAAVVGGNVVIGLTGGAAVVGGNVVIGLTGGAAVVSGPLRVTASVVTVGGEGFAVPFVARFRVTTVVGSPSSSELQARLDLVTMDLGPSVGSWVPTIPSFFFLSKASFAAASCTAGSPFIFITCGWMDGQINEQTESAIRVWAQKSAKKVMKSYCYYKYYC
jgi:hypothetical protein